MHFAVVSNGNTCLIVSENLVLLDLGKTRSAHNYATSLIFVDLIIGNVVGAIENDYAVWVIIDVVVLDPAEAGFDGKNALWAGLINQVV